MRPEDGKMAPKQVGTLRFSAFNRGFGQFMVCFDILSVHFDVLTVNIDVLRGYFATIPSRFCHFYCRFLPL